MAFATKNDFMNGRLPVPTGDDTSISAPRFIQDCTAADSAADNVGVIGILPSDKTPVLPLIVGTSGLGGSAAISIGILDEDTGDISTKPEDGGAAWATGVAVGAAAVAQVAITAAMLAVKKSGLNRKIAVKFTAAGSAAGTLGITVPYRSPN
jgi:hypothetical protein